MHDHELLISIASANARLHALTALCKLINALSHDPLNHPAEIRRVAATILSETNPKRKRRASAPVSTTSPRRQRGGSQDLPPQRGGRPVDVGGAASSRGNQREVPPPLSRALREREDGSEGSPPTSPSTPPQPTPPPRAPNSPPPLPRRHANNETQNHNPAFHGLAPSAYRPTPQRPWLHSRAPPGRRAEGRAGRHNDFLARDVQPPRATLQHLAPALLRRPQFCLPSS